MKYVETLLACAFFLLSTYVAARSPLPEVQENELQPNEDPLPLMSNSLDVYPDLPCHIEVHLTKRVPGHCVKLGHGGLSCMAGTYVHPFHQDCMLR